MADNSTLDLAAFTGIQKTTWSGGDFHALALPIMHFSEQLVYAVDPRPGQRVLDVACGSGNASLVAARRYCDVTGLDFAPNLLERARIRARAEGSRAEFIEGDAQTMPFEDASFDAVVSTFGVMFAPDQERAASELLRVTKPGGRIGLASWTPEGFGGQFFRLVSSYAPPPPPGAKPGTRWGTEAGLQGLLGGGISGMKVEIRAASMQYPSVDFLMDVFFRSFGPLVALSQDLDAPTLAALRNDVAQFLTKMNRANDGTLDIPGEFALAIAERK